VRLHSVDWGDTGQALLFLTGLGDSTHSFGLSNAPGEFVTTAAGSQSWQCVMPTLFLRFGAYSSCSKRNSPLKRVPYTLHVSSSALNWRRLLTIVGRCHIAADNLFESLVTSIDLLLTPRVRASELGQVEPGDRWRLPTKALLKRLIST
jgi:hypothetical protein